MSVNFTILLLTVQLEPTKLLLEYNLLFLFDTLVSATGNCSCSKFFVLIVIILLLAEISVAEQLSKISKLFTLFPSKFIVFNFFKFSSPLISLI